MYHEDMAWELEPHQKKTQKNKQIACYGNENQSSGRKGGIKDRLYPGPGRCGQGEEFGLSLEGATRKSQELVQCC